MNGRMVTGERASGRTSKKSVVLRWASAAEGLWTVQGEFGGHDEFRGNLGRVVVVEERVTSVGVFLDVVIDAEVGQQSFQPLGGTAVPAVLAQLLPTIGHVPLR